MRSCKTRQNRTARLIWKNLEILRCGLQRNAADAVLAEAEMSVFQQPAGGI